MRHVRMLCLFCVASYSLTGTSMAQSAAPANLLLPHHASAIPHPAPLAVPPAALPQPQFHRGRPVNAWSTAPAAPYVSPFQNSPAISSSRGFAFQSQNTAALQAAFHGSMGPPPPPGGQPSNLHFIPQPTLPSAFDDNAQPTSFANPRFPARPLGLTPQPQHFLTSSGTQRFVPHATPQMQTGHNPAEMHSACVPHSSGEESDRPLSAGHSFPNVRYRNQSATAAPPIHVYPPNIRLKN